MQLGVGISVEVNSSGTRHLVLTISSRLCLLECVVWTSAVGKRALCAVKEMGNNSVLSKMCSKVRQISLLTLFHLCFT